MKCSPKRDSPCGPVPGHHRRPVVFPDRQVDVAGVAFPRVRLGHERDAHALRVGDLLGPGLVDRMVVARRHGLGVPEGDLVLAQVALALGRLDLEARPGHAVAEPAEQRLDPGGPQDGVIDVVGVGRGEVAVPGGLRGGVGVVVHHELQLGAGHGLQAALGQPVGLGLQDLPRGGHHGRAIVPGEVGDDHRRGFLPGHPAQRAHVGHHHEVAVAGLPGRHRVAVDGVHLHVHREQVVAPLDDAAHHVVEEELRREPLALQPALHVGEGDDDRVDVALAHLHAELLEREHPAAPGVGGRTALLLHEPPVSACPSAYVLPGPD